MRAALLGAEVRKSRAKNSGPAITNASDGESFGIVEEQQWSRPFTCC